MDLELKDFMDFFLEAAQDGTNIWYLNLEGEAVHVITGQCFYHSSALPCNGGNISRSGEVVRTSPELGYGFPVSFDNIYKRPGAVWDGLYLPMGSKSCNCSIFLEQCLGLNIKSQSKTISREGLDCGIMKFLQEFPPVSPWLADGLG